MTDKLKFKNPIEARYQSILSPEAINFVYELHRRFNERRLELLAIRKKKQTEIDNGIFPDFLRETEHIRKGDWKVLPVNEDIHDRRVEITGPVDRKMIINALNSGAKVFMADFEDSNSPTWTNNLEGQINLFDAVRRQIKFTNEQQKKYSLNEKIATLFVRARGWHLDEEHVSVDGEFVSGGLFDFGIYFFHNAKELIKRGSGPYFYLPKIESHLEARLWNNVFKYSQDYIGIPQGTIKATVLIETILAAFETEEILYELKEHSAGLNCGRWDYIFSYIKKLRAHKKYILPDRSQVTMNVPFMKAYSEHTIKTCHKRGAFAMGGMAAQIPIKNDPEANRLALEKVRADKKREVLAGHDGTWVAHPGLIPIAMKEFDEHMPGKNQIDKLRDDVNVSVSDLLEPPQGEITLEGIRNNIDVCIQYLKSWIEGLGCVPIYNLMEDAATAEISRTQLWQWIKYNAKTNQGITIDSAFFKQELDYVVQSLKNSMGASGESFEQAVRSLKELVLSEELEDFLTLNAYKFITCK